jgi:hypothetical protein
MFIDPFVTDVFVVISRIVFTLDEASMIVGTLAVVLTDVFA